MLTPEIRAYYDRGGESTRLTDGVGRLEFLRTWDVMTRALPPAPARILDVGGATGVYAKPLAEAGYQVTVIDPVAGHVAASASLPGVTAIEGDARELPVAEAAADAVLMLGPLYHLPEREDRDRAWRAARRAVRPGGLVVGAVISRFASFVDGVAQGFFAEPGFRGLVEDALADGVHRSAERGLPWFTDAYFHRPDEPAAEARAAGLHGVRTVAVEGPVWTTGAALLRFLDEPALTGTLLDLLRRIEGEPSLLGSSSHLLTLGRRPR
jgi:SAM-dependent methyltransferase